MGSILSCVGSGEKSTTYLTDVYDEADDGGDAIISPTRDSGFSSLNNTRSKRHSKNNNDSPTDDIQYEAVDKTDDKQGNSSSSHQTDQGKFHLQHDSKGYTLVFPKSSPTFPKPPPPSTQEARSSHPPKKKVPQVPNGKHIRKSSPPKDTKTTPNNKNANKTKNKISMDSGSYCNIELPNSTENGNKHSDEKGALGETQDDIYENDVPPKPELKKRNPRNPKASPKVAMKPKNEGTDLKYVEVEVMHKPEPKGKQPHKGKQLEKKKPAAPSVEYTEVIEENGVVKLVLWSFVKRGFIKLYYYSCKLSKSTGWSQRLRFELSVSFGYKKHLYNNRKTHLVLNDVKGEIECAL